MINNKYYKLLFAVFLLFIVLSCNRKNVAEEKEPETRTPVKVANVNHDNLEETVELYATSVFRIKDNVKANLNGYIQQVHASVGEIVKKGQLLFTLKTKEASAFTSRSNDTALNFSGIVKIYSPLSGSLTALSKQNGDYVQDGDEIAVVADQNSLVFILNVPFELKKYLKTGTACNIILPDKDIIPGVIGSEMPVVDAASQTQSYIVKPTSTTAIPENLIAKINIVKSTKQNAQTLSKDAVLTNELQSEWWVMKLINDSTAVKVRVIKGIETADKVEITEPSFSATDRIIVSGNYGLEDTAKVVVEK